MEKKLQWITNTKIENIPYFSRAARSLGAELEINNEALDYDGRSVDGWVAILSNASFRDLYFETSRYRFIDLLEKRRIGE